MTRLDAEHQPFAKGGSGTNSGHVPVQGYYVIIGRGGSALFNHACLVYQGRNLLEGGRYTWGERRLGFYTLKGSGTFNSNYDPAAVMHIGFREPWSGRGGERMGQHPRMLNLYRAVCPSASLSPELDGNTDDWLKSYDYANMVANMEYAIRSHYTQGGRFTERVLEREVGDGLHFARGTGGPRLALVTGFVGTIEKYENAPGEYDKKREVEPTEFGDATCKFGGGPADGGFITAVEKEWWKKAKELGEKHEPGAQNPKNYVKYQEWLNPNYPFRLNVWLLDHIDEKGNGNWHHEHVYAYKIDICTGLVPALPIASWLETAPGKETLADPLRRELIACQLAKPDRRWRRIMSGMHYIGTEFQKGKVVIIDGGTPTGAQSLQHALQMPNRDVNTGRPVEATADFDHVRFAPNGGADLTWWSTLGKFGTCMANLPGDRNLLEVVANDVVSPKEDDYKTFYPTSEVANTKEALARYHGLTALPRPSMNEPTVRERLAIRRGRPFHVMVDGLQKVDNVGLKAIVEADGRRLRCTFKLQLKFGAEPTDDEKKKSPSATFPEGLPWNDELVVDQFVYSAGAQGKPDVPGTVGFMLGAMAQGFTKLYDNDLSPWPVGVSGGGADPDVEPKMGRIRVLGVCSCYTIKDMGLKDVVPYANTILAEGRAGGGGLNVWIPNTRRANHLLTPVVQLSTATTKELAAAGMNARTYGHVIATRRDDLAGHALATWYGVLRTPGTVDFAAAIQSDTPSFIF